MHLPEALGPVLRAVLAAIIADDPGGPWARSAGTTPVPCSRPASTRISPETAQLVAALPTLHRTVRAFGRLPAAHANILIDASGATSPLTRLLRRWVGAHYEVVVIDVHGGERGPELGRWVSPSALVDVAEIGPAELAELLQSHPRAAVLDCTRVAGLARSRTVSTVLTLVQAQRTRTGRPHWLIIDGAEGVLRDSGIAPHALDLTQRGHCLIARSATHVPLAVAANIDVTLAAADGLW